MRAKKSTIRVLSSRQDVQLYVHDAVAGADAHRDALGFFPAKVFEEFAQKECLLIAVDASDGTPRYAGHLLFDCRFPKAHVLQMLCSPAHRRLGVATQLLDQLKSTLTGHGFIAIHARVAEDLQDANQFWSQQNFYVQAEKKGGKARNRRILVRCHELITPQLFPRSGFDGANPLGLDVQSPEERPLFLLDLNVLFDLGPRRARNEEVINLFKAERSGVCSLAISTELISELKRTATVGRSDPMQDIAKILPTFALAEGDAAKTLLNELARLVFPDSVASGSLTANESSDLRHLATVVQHQLAGLITSDGPILNAAAEIARKYGVQVLSPLAFSSSLSSHEDEQSFETADVQTIAVGPVKDADLAAAREMLAKFGLSATVVSNEWLLGTSGGYGGSSYGAWINSRLVGYLALPPWMGSGAVLARVAIDESVPQARSVCGVLLKLLLEQHSGIDTIQFAIDLPSGQSSVREAAWALGFGGTAQGTRLSKVALRQVVVPLKWDKYRAQLQAVSQLKLPDKSPEFRAIDQQVQVIRPDGNRSHVSIEALETLLSPLLLCLPGRPAVITPVQRVYAQLLLGHSTQRSFLPSSKAVTRSERHYLSDPKTLRHFRRGTIILFYESGKQGGAGAVVAAARVRRAYLKPVDAIDAPDLDPSVLDSQTLQKIGASKIKTVTIFDNVMAFSTPVLMSRLQALGCGRPTDLITTRPISSDQMMAILEAGFSNA